MGYYINNTSDGLPLPAKGKIEALKNDGATITDDSFKENLICIIDTGMFESVAYADSEEQLNTFKKCIDMRERTFLTYPHAKELAK